jgi:predicted MFS family arabinose efflux permease
LRRSAVLGERDFRLILLVWGLSAMGDFLAVAALTLRVQHDTGSGFAVALLLIAAAAPVALLNPVSGWLVDHREPRTLLSSVAAAQVAVAVALALVDSTAATIALVLALNCGLAVERPTLFTLIPRIVGEAQASRGYAWFESVKYGALTVGLALGGVLTGAFSARTAILIDAATFGLTAVAALSLRTRRRLARRDDDVDATAPTPTHALTAGMRLIRADRVLRVTIAIVVAAVLFGGVDNVAGVFFATDTLHAGDAGYGALAAAWGLGMVGGAALAGRRVRAATAATGVVVATAVMGAGIAATGASPSIAVAVACFVAGGAGNGFENVAMRVLLQARATDALRGRAYAAFQGLLVPAEFAALAVGGVLVEVIGPRATFAVAGLATLGAVALSVPALRRSETPAPAPPGRR